MIGKKYKNNQIESDVHIPKITTAIDIADVLGVSLDELVGREFEKEGAEK